MNASNVWKFSKGYLLRSAPLHLVWEMVQLPLYTLWKEPDTAAIVYAIAHCTLGDLLIATCTLLLGVVAVRFVSPKRRTFFQLALVSIILGVGYTIFSEWINTVILRSWEYSDLMPQVLGIVVSPVIQWTVIPSIVFISMVQYV